MPCHTAPDILTLELFAVGHWRGGPARKRGLHSAACRLLILDSVPQVPLICALRNTAGADAMAHLTGAQPLSLAQLQALAAAGPVGMGMYGNAYPAAPGGYPGPYPPPGGYYWPPPGAYWTPGPSSVAGALAGGAGPFPVLPGANLEQRLSSASVASTRTSVDRGSGDASGDLLTRCQVCWLPAGVACLSVHPFPGCPASEVTI